MEEWRPVEGYPWYEVSNHGRIRSWLRGGSHLNKFAEEPKIMKPIDSGKINPLKVSLCKNGTIRQASLTRLILEAFHGPCPDGMEACHNDGNPKNNHAPNLRWDTHINNEEDKRRHGTWYDKNRKLSAGDVIEMRELSEEGWHAYQLSDRFGVGIGTVWKIVNGERWKHVGGPIHEKGTAYDKRPPKRNYLVDHPELSKGESNGRAILTSNQVVEIREQFANGISRHILSEQYGVKPVTIAHIAYGRLWNHVDGPISKPQSR